MNKTVVTCCIVGSLLLTSISSCVSSTKSHSEDDLKKENVSYPDMVLIKGGCFEMGDTFGDGYERERPAHEVCLVHDYYIGKYEVTVREYMKFVKATGSNIPEWLKPGSSYNIKTGRDKHYQKLGEGLTGDNSPVTGVSWENVSAYAKWLSEKSTLSYRLPTEAEWAYAARSGGKKENWSGTSSSESMGDYVWYKKNSGGRPHSVGKKKPNGLGLYDMSGNVWEWASDKYEKKYFKNSPRNNPKGPSKGSDRVVRGGSWRSYAGYTRASLRDGDMPIGKGNDLGFRLARTP